LEGAIERATNMILRFAVAALLALSLMSCGVKTDLELPTGMQADQKRPDPSRPPQPLGQ
jgi:predicted small lipoprotein YifL